MIQYSGIGMAMVKNRGANNDQCVWRGERNFKNWGWLTGFWPGPVGRLMVTLIEETDR